VEESFTITVLHKGAEKEITGRLRVSAYTHQFLFSIGDAEIILEKDDEGNFRALNPSALSDTGHQPDPSLVRALIEEMERIMKD